MTRLVTEGDRVYIEFCIHCDRHQWCTKHNAAKYMQYFTSIRESLLTIKPELTICPNIIPPALSQKFYARPENEVLVVPGKLGWPRLGAFEIYYKGKLVFSKLNTGLWPQAEVVAEKVREVDEQMEREAMEKERKPRKKKGKGKRKKSYYRSPGRGYRSQENFYSRGGSARRTSSKPTSATARPRTAHPGKAVGFSPPVESHFPPRDKFEREDSSGSERNSQRSKGQELAKQREVEGMSPIMQQVEVQRQEEPEPFPALVDIPPIESHAETGNTDAEPAILSNTDAAEAAPVVEIQRKRSSSSSSSSSSSKKSSPHSDSKPSEPVFIPPPIESAVTPQAPDLETQLQEQLPPSRYSLDRKEAVESPSPVHPLRPITKSYEVSIPMGKYTNKKITYINESDSEAYFTLESSHPKEMEVRESSLTIPPGAKGALKLQFNPVYEEITKRFYLYVDREGKPWECFEFVVTFD